MGPRAKKDGKRKGGKEQEEDEGNQKNQSALKKAKKEQEEDLESVDGKAIASKGELDKMYQAMKYLDKKGKKHPLAHYNQLTTRKEKTDFYAKYLKDKKFEFVSVDEETEVKTSNSHGSFKGWCTKWQIADYEKMPVGHALLEAKLASLPSRAHPIQQWRDAGEMEYYYESNQVEKNDETLSHGLRVQGHGTAQPKAVESLLQGLAASSSHGPHKAIEDGNAPEKDAEDEVKDEAEGDEEEKKNEILEEWNELKGKLQKSTRSMGDLCMEAQTIQGALGHKLHLEGLVKKVRENLAVLEPAKQKALEALGLINTFTIKDTKVQEMQNKVKELGQLQEECQAHIEAFKQGAFREAKILLKSM